jgi:hypothetical protein
VNVKIGLERYYGSNRAAKVIYGAILLFVFIAGMHHKGVSGAMTMAVSTLVAALTIVFAEVYSEVIGERIKQRGKLTHAERRDIVRDAVAILSMSIWPSLIFLLSGTKLFALETAYTLAMAFCLAILLAFSYWANRMSGLSRNWSLLWAGVTLVIGVAVIVLKYKYGH